MAIRHGFSQIALVPDTTMIEPLLFSIDTLGVTNILSRTQLFLNPSPGESIMYVLVWEKTGLLLSLTLMIFAMTAEAQERKTGASSEDTANSVPYRAMADSISRTVHDDASDVLVKQLNKVFDDRWRFRIVEHRIHEDVVVVLGELSAGGGSRQQFGTAVLKGPRPIG